MKKLIYIIMCTAVLFMSQSCSKEAPFSGEEETMGQVLTSDLLLEFINEDLQSRAGTEVNLADFTVAFRKNTEQTPYVTYKYSEMPEVVSLPAGLYRVEAYYGEEVSAEWEAPYYFGELADPLTITAKKITAIEKPVKCKLANVKVSVEFNDELKQLMSTDSKVDVTVGANAMLSFTKNESRNGFFKAANTMIADFLGNINGQEAKSNKRYNDVKPGTHYHIMFVYKAAEIVGDGKIDSAGGIKVNAQVTVTDVNEGTNITVDDGDESLEDDRNKGGDDDDDNPENPDDPTPPSDGPVIVGGNEAIVLSDGDATGTLKPVVVTNDMECVIKITSTTGITQFTADIKSPNLTPEELGTIGLTDHLDLCDPGDFKGALQNLGLLSGETVRGEKSVEFNLTQFLTLLGVFGPNQHSFVLTVGDESGTVVKTLTLKYE